MEGIEFEKESYGKPIAMQKEKKSWAVKLVRKIGGKYVKSDEQASMILVIIAIIFFILAIYNFVHATRKPAVSVQEQAQQNTLMQQQLEAAKNH